MKRFGLKEREIGVIRDVATRFPTVECVLIFGSRAKGTEKIGSDVDLAIKGERVTPEQVLELKDLLEEETLIPYFFDILHYNTLQNPALKSHIDRVGKPIYQRASIL